MLARAAARLETLLCNAVGVAAAALVVAEVVILFAGVVARYGLHSSLTWSDELASILFIWLAMLGSVIAVHRAEHMRMGALIDGKSEARQAWAAAFTAAVGIAFLGTLLPLAWRYATADLEVVTPVLEISATWRAGALPAGIGLMLLVTLLKVVQSGSWRRLGGVVLGLAVAGAALKLGQPLLATLGNYQLLFFFVGIVGAAVLAGIPIAYAFGVGTVTYLAIATRMPLTIVINRMDEGMSHVILLAIPLFVILGLLIEVTGMARLMIQLLATLVGNIRGGLQYVLVAAMYLVSGISGSKAADMAAVMPVLLPEMRRRSLDEAQAIALLAATGAQTETVPPSLVLITVGSVTGVSIAALFTAGLLPSLLLGIALCGVVAFRHRNSPRIEGGLGIPRSRLGGMLLAALPALALPFLIRAAVVKGVATATEVSTLGIVYTLLYAMLAVVLFRQKVSLRRIGSSLVATAALSGAILLIIGTATAMAWALTQSGFSRQLASAMTSLPGGSTTFMAASVVLFILLGAILEGIPAIVLFGPLLFPVARLLGINDVHYAVVAVVAMGIGLFAPPFGYGFYVACAIGKVDPSRVLRPVMGYLAVMLAGLILIAAVPWITTGFL